MKLLTTPQIRERALLNWPYGLGSKDQVIAFALTFVTTSAQDVNTLLDLLRELYVQVKGECPALLDEDSDGDGALDIKIDAILSSQEEL